MLPDGSRSVYGDPASSRAGEIHLHHDAAARRMLLGGEIGAGEAYMDGLWSSPDLPALLRVAALNREALALARGWWRLPLRIRKTLAHRGASQHHRREPSQHRRPLRPGQRLLPPVPRRDDDLLERRLRLARPVARGRPARTSSASIAERAGLRGGEHVLEIGSGWGGFALYAAGELGCRVTTITVSQAQHELATERIAAAGLSDRVSVELRDYREIRGSYDAIVSIEMLEAVGAEYYATFFEACDRALAPGGRMSLQVITFPDVAYEPQRRGANWIQTYIFPGGLLPSLAVIERSLHGTRLLVRRVDDIAPSYVLHAASAGGSVPRAARRGPGDGLRRALHPQVGLLPRDQRGGLRDRRDPGSPDRAREGARSRLTQCPRHRCQRAGTPRVATGSSTGPCRKGQRRGWGRVPG